MPEPAWGDPTRQVVTFDELLERIKEREYARGYGEGREAAREELRAAITARRAAHRARRRALPTRTYSVQTTPARTSADAIAPTQPRPASRSTVMKAAIRVK